MILLATVLSDAESAFRLPEFSWETVPRFVHCGPDYEPQIPGRLPLDLIYERIYYISTIEIHP